MLALWKGCAWVVAGVAVGPWMPGPWWCWAAGAVLGVALPILSDHAGCWRGAGAGAMSLGIALVLVQPVGPELVGEVAVEGQVVGGRSGRAADLEVRRVQVVGGPWVSASGRVRVWFPDRAPGLGAGVLVRGRADGVDAQRALPGALLGQAKVGFAKVGFGSSPRASPKAIKQVFLIF